MMRAPLLPLLAILLTAPAAAQEAPEATDVTAAAIRTFLDALPRDRVSDRPIRAVDVTGDYRVGVFGPESLAGGVNKHEVNTTEIDYMLSGAATLVTGGTMRPPGPPIPGTSARSLGHTPHWWSNLESDIEHLIIRPDPDNRLQLK